MATTQDLAIFKQALGIDHSDHDDLLQEDFDIGLLEGLNYIGFKKWRNVTHPLVHRVLRQAAIAYGRELYDGNIQALITDPRKLHIFYRILKPFTLMSPEDFEGFDIQDFSNLVSLTPSTGSGDVTRQEYNEIIARLDAIEAMPSLPTPNPDNSDQGSFPLVGAQNVYLLRRLALWGTHYAQVALPRIPQRTGRDQIGINQTWAIEPGINPNPFSVGPLKFQEQTFNDITALMIPLTMPTDWLGIGMMAMIGNKIIQTDLITGDFFKFRDNLFLINLAEGEGAVPKAVLKIQRNRRARKIRIAWGDSKVFTENQFLAVNGAGVGFSDRIPLPAPTEAFSDAHEDGFIGVWFEAGDDPIHFISSLYLSAGDGKRPFYSWFEDWVNSPEFTVGLDFAAKNNLQVDGIDGFYIPTRERETLDSQELPIVVRFPPDDLFGGSLYPIETGEYQLYISEVLNLSGQLAENLKIEIFPVAPSFHA